MQVDPLRIFIDCEFTSFEDPDLISIGLVTSTGAEFYGENTEFCQHLSSKWVESNIYPLLNPIRHGYGRAELSARLWTWLDELPCDFVIFMIDYATDYELMYELLGSENHPKELGGYNTRDLMVQRALEWNSVAEHHEVCQDKLQRLRGEFHEGFMEHFFRTKEVQHHALSDARALRAGYQRLVDKFNFPL